MDVYRWLCILLLGCQGLLLSPQALAVMCSEIFPQGRKSAGVTLDLSFLRNETLQHFVSRASTHVDEAGDHFYAGGSIGNGGALVVPTGPGLTTRIYVQGDLTIGPHASINKDGSADNLILFVTGKVFVKTDKKEEGNNVNALIYALGDIDIGNDNQVRGALTSNGKVDIHPQHARVTYDAEAVSKADFGDLIACKNEDDAASHIHHYRLEYSSQALTCQPHPLVLRACANDSCSEHYDQPETLVLTPSGWIGGSSITFTGSTALALAIRQPQTVTLGLAEPAAAPLHCYPDGRASNVCALTFADSGLRIEVPDLLAGKPANVTVSAVRKDDASPACVAALDGEKELALWTSHLDPEPGERIPGVDLEIAGKPVGTSATLLRLSFVNGRATSELRYADAGKLQLHARYTDAAADGGEVRMEGASAPFVSRPYGLHVEHDADCRGATVAECTKLAVAGDSFPLRIRAVAWTRDDQPRTADELASNPVTPNFRLAGIRLSSRLDDDLVAPDQGVFFPDRYDHALGERVVLHARQSEVGIFRLTVTPGRYHGQEIGSSEAQVGRFVPAYLQVSGAAGMESCDGVSYQGETVPYRSGSEPYLQVQAFNRQGVQTNNYYADAFWRLPMPAGQYWTQEGDRQLEVPGELQLLDAETQLEPWSGGDGRRFLWRGSGWNYMSGNVLPGHEDLPFSIEQRFSAAVLTDEDGVCSRRAGEGDCLATDAHFALEYSGSEIRLGRLRIGNANGSELAALSLPWVLESWQAPGGFRASLGDTCTADELAPTALLTEHTGKIKDVAITGTLSGNGTTGFITLSAPHVDGSVKVAVPALPHWLHFDWQGRGVREAATGLATFGIYQGAMPIVFRREVYR